MFLMQITRRTQGGDTRVSTDGIETTVNEVYYGISIDGIQTTPNEVYGVSADSFDNNQRQVVLCQSNDNFSPIHVYENINIRIYCV